jgi:hypothetical protein
VDWFVSKLRVNLFRLRCVVLALLFLAAAVTLATPKLIPVYGMGVYGDMNVEPVTGTLVRGYVMALTKITVTQPITIQSVSMYLSYTGSDGSQCLKFGVYRDDGKPWGQSSPLYQPLVASTGHEYCLGVGDFGPGWETWQLAQSDYMSLSTSGVYWLCTLAKQGYGTVYHFTYTGTYGGQFLYQYGYFSYGFPASYDLGFPPVPFADQSLGSYQIILPLNVNNIGEYNAPYSFYVKGT